MIFFDLGTFTLAAVCLLFFIPIPEQTEGKGEPEPYSGVHQGDEKPSQHRPNTPDREAFPQGQNEIFGGHGKEQTVADDPHPAFGLAFLSPSPSRRRGRGSLSPCWPPPGRDFAISGSTGGCWT